MSTYAYVNPVVAVILGWLVLAEPLTPRTIVASVVIVVAVALIVTRPDREPDAAPTRRVAGARGRPRPRVAPPARAHDGRRHA